MLYYYKINILKKTPDTPLSHTIQKVINAQAAKPV